VKIIGEFDANIYILSKIEFKLSFKILNYLKEHKNLSQTSMQP